MVLGVRQDVGEVDVAVVLGHESGTVQGFFHSAQDLGNAHESGLRGLDNEVGTGVRSERWRKVLKSPRQNRDFRLTFPSLPQFRKHCFHHCHSPPYLQVTRYRCTWSSCISQLCLFIAMACGKGVKSQKAEE